MTTGIEVISILKSSLVKKVSSTIFEKTKEYLSNTLKRKLKNNKVDFENALNDHLQVVLNWASEISFKDLQKAKSLTQTYIDLDILLTPMKFQFDKVESAKKIKLNGIFEKYNSNIILLGQPGAGKTTSLKKICNEVLFPVDFDRTSFDYVILIRINELTSTYNYSVFQKIFSILNIEIENFENDRDILEKTVINVLNNKPALIVIDGIDEIPTNAHKYFVFDELNKLSLSLVNSRFIASIRSGDYNVNIEKTKVFEICPLSIKQVQEFTSKWFDDKALSKGFLKELKSKSYSDLLERPIFISLLCSIYERAGNLPEKPKTIYKKAVSMLLEEWNQQWRIKRETKYSQLDVDRKFDFLSNLAYNLTVEKESLFFNSQGLKEFYKSVNVTFNLPQNEAFQVITELESHHGIFIQDGHDLYRFYHKSMQEYLTAEYILGFPSIPESIDLLNSIPNELAISVALSSRPTEYLAELILKRLKTKLTSGFIGPFISRLFIENPSFDINPLFALSLIYINTIIIKENNEKAYSTKYLRHFLNSSEFKKSFNELDKTRNFRELTKYNGLITYTYSGQNDLSYLYSEQLKIEAKYCTQQ